MGTRADFYVGRGAEAEWLGSIGWDGYPAGIDDGIRYATTEADYRAAVEAFFKTRDDLTRPAQGWPWPWQDSQTTDYAYAFDGGAVWASSFGAQWFLAKDPEPDVDDPAHRKVAVFPNMKDRQNVALDKRSGLMILGG